MATARLRQTFHYPEDDSGDEDAYRGLDEEEQEDLIKEIKNEDRNRNEFYKRAFMTVPVVSVLAFIPSFLMAEAIRVRLLSLICIVNLLTSAYVLAIVPVSYTTNDKQPYKSPALGDVQNPPWRMYVEYANVFLSIVLSANAYVFKDRPGVYGSFWLLCFLPAACSGLVSLAKHLMTSVDIGELEKLKYLYKGA